MSKNNKPTYSIHISKEKFEKLRDNKQFQTVLRLARILNSMRFSWASIVNLEDKDTPAADRDITASFLYMCALLYESFQDTKTYKCIYNELKDEFNQLDVFKNGLQKLEEDSIRKDYHNSIFKTVRDKIVFHFDPDVFPEILTTYIAEENEILTQTHSEQAVDMDYSLADKLTLHFLMDTSQLDNVSAERFKVLLIKVVELSKKFMNYSELLIADVLNKFG